MHKQVIDFWFDEIEPIMWFKKDDDFDRLLHSRFGEIWRAAAAGELAHWRDTIEGRLAEVIVLDQFSRNLFRGTPQSFACDGMALILAQEAIRSGECERLSREQRGFLYLPFMHSESPLIHQQALVLYTELNNGDQLEFELRHKAIIDRFGRYPHRNAILGRTSTPEEEAFYSSPDRVLISDHLRPAGKNSRPGAAISVIQRERLFPYAMPLFPHAELPIISAVRSAIYGFL